jgi:epoxide hydrolase-like predicted phosphatase
VSDDPWVSPALNQALNPVTRVKAVFFDFGGVLTTPVADTITAWLDRDGIDPASFSRVLKEWLGRSAQQGTPIHLLETGAITAAEFDSLLGAELRYRDGAPVASDGLLRGLFAEMNPDEGMFSLVSEIKASGVQVGLLSNSWGNTYPRERIDPLFDSIVISGEVGMRKPDADIYEFAAASLGVEPGEVIFVDDAEPNTEGAERVGMTAIHHRDEVSTRLRLRQLGLTVEAAAAMNA